MKSWENACDRQIVLIEVSFWICFNYGALPWWVPYLLEGGLA
jgi:hypothetical protein